MGVDWCINSHDQTDAVEFVHKKVFSLILRVHASVSIISSDNGELGSNR